MSESRRSYNACLAGALLIVILAVVVPCWTIPLILHYHGLQAGPLAICGVWMVLLFGYDRWECRRWQRNSEEWTR